MPWLARRSEPEMVQIRQAGQRRRHPGQPLTLLPDTQASERLFDGNPAAPPQLRHQRLAVRCACEQYDVQRFAVPHGYPIRGQSCPGLALTQVQVAHALAVGLDDIIRQQQPMLGRQHGPRQAGGFGVADRGAE